MSIFKTEILRLTLRTYDFPSHGLSTRFAVSSINFLQSCQKVRDCTPTFIPQLHQHCFFLSDSVLQHSGFTTGQDLLLLFSPTERLLALQKLTRRKETLGSVPASFLSDLWNKICCFFSNEVLPSSWEIEGDINSLCFYSQPLGSHWPITNWELSHTWH